MRAVPPIDHDGKVLVFQLRHRQAGELGFRAPAGDRRERFPWHSIRMGAVAFLEISALAYAVRLVMKPNRNVDALQGFDDRRGIADAGTSILIGVMLGSEVDGQEMVRHYIVRDVQGIQLAHRMGAAAARREQRGAHGGG